MKCCIVGKELFTYLKFEENFKAQHFHFQKLLQMQKFKSQHFLCYCHFLHPIGKQEIMMA